jgi:hypothetical protein
VWEVGLDWIGWDGVGWRDGVRRERDSGQLGRRIRRRRRRKRICGGIALGVLVELAFLSPASVYTVLG